MVDERKRHASYGKQTLDTMASEHWSVLKSHTRMGEAIFGRCFEIMVAEREKQFDPRLLDAFVALREQIVQVQIQLADVG